LRTQRQWDLEKREEEFALAAVAFAARRADRLTVSCGEAASGMWRRGVGAA